MNDIDKRYSIHRGLFSSLCVLVILVSFIRACDSRPQATAQVAAFPTPSSYREEFCSDPHIFDYRNKNPEQIKIHLNEGAFCDEYFLPTAWKTFNSSRSKAIDDYVSVWCNGNPKPRRIQPYYESNIDPSFTGCAEPSENYDHFWIVGRGSVLLTRLSTNEIYARQAAAHEEETRYKETRTEPDMGERDTYEMIIKQCHRSAEVIKCQGSVTNKTDATEDFHLERAWATDNEGNSFFLGIGQYNFPNGYREQHLIPSVPVNFDIEISDGHQKATSINLRLTAVYGSYFWNPHLDEMTYRGIPIQ